MTKLWNPITQLTPLDNYLSNCVIISSYTSSYKTNLVSTGKKLALLILQPWALVFHPFSLGHPLGLDLVFFQLGGGG